MASRRGSLFDFLAEAQDYNSVLAPLKKLAPDYDWKPLETEIAEARRALRRADRIMWYLRIWRLFAVEGLRVLNKTAQVEELAAFTQDVVDRFVADYRNRFDRSFALDKSISAHQIISYLRPIIAAQIPAVEAVQFGSQNPNTLIPELQALERDYAREKEERDRDKNDPLRRIDHAKPPTMTSDYARRTGGVGQTIDCEFCGIKAADPSTWGRCKEREISLLKFDDRGNMLPESASLYATRWVLLKDAQACRREAESMIHCGNAPQIKPGDQILSLRQPVMEGGARKEIAHLTFILHGDGMLGEMKAPQNNKPGRRWHPHIVALLRLPLVQGIRGGGYMANSNFNTSDLNSELLSKLMREKPQVIENDALLKLIREKKVPFTPQIAERLAKLDQYALRNLLDDAEMPWTRETLAALIAGKPRYDLLLPIVTKIPGLDRDGRLRNYAGSFREMVFEYPEIVSLVGERNLLPYVDQLGAGPFSEEALKDMPPNGAAALVHSQADLKAIPENVRRTSEFVNSLVGGDPDTRGYARRRGNPEAINWLSDDELRLLDPDIAVARVQSKEGWDRLPQVITVNQENRKAVTERLHSAILWFVEQLSEDELKDIVTNEPATYKYLPDNFKRLTADIAAEHMQDHQMEHIPPEMRNAVAWRKHYEYAAAHRPHDNRLKDIPKDYRTDRVISSLLGAHPEDIKDFSNEITVPIAKSLISKLINSSNANLLGDLPRGILRNQEVFDHAFETVSKMNSHYSSRGLAPFPLAMVHAKSPEIAISMVANGHVAWKNIPPSLRTPDIIGRLRDIEKVPLPYLTPEVIGAIATHQQHTLSKLPPRVLTPDAARRALEARRSDTHQMSAILFGRMAKPIPKDLLLKFCEDGAVPIAQMPREAMTPSNIYRRLASPVSHFSSKAEADDKLSDIPRNLLNADMAESVIRAHPLWVTDLPKSLLTPELFTLWVERVGNRVRGYGTPHPTQYQQGIRAFPISSLTPDGVADLIRGRIMAPDDAEKLPPDLLTSEVIAAIIGVAPEKAAVFSAKLDDEALGNGIVDNWQVMKQVPPSRWNTKLAFAAINRWAPDLAYYHYQKHDDEDSITFQLRRIPRSVWNADVWREAIGHMASLDECPKDILNDTIIQRAVERKPSEIAFVDDPAKFLNRMRDKLARNDKDFTMLLERKGVIKGKKGWINARDLPNRVKLPHGGSAVLMKSGPANVRVYIFDSHDRVVMNLYTEKGAIKLPPTEGNNGRAGAPAIKAAKRNYTPILEAARAMLGSYDAGQLNYIGIHGNGHGTFYEEKELPRENTRHNPASPLKWVARDTVNGKLHIAYLDDAGNDDPILRVVFGSSGSGWNKTEAIHELDVLDRKACIKHGKAIFDHLSRYHGVKGYQLERLGIIEAKNGSFSLAETQIAESGEFSIWLGGSVYPKWGDRVPGNKIALFGPEGLMAYGMIKANNTIGKAKVVGYHDAEDQAKLIDMFTKLGNAALAKKAQNALEG